MAISTERLFSSVCVGNIFLYLCVYVSSEIRSALEASSGIPACDYVPGLPGQAVGNPAIR